MTPPTVLTPDRADMLRRVLIALATAAGLGAALYLLSSEAAAEFLKEGPARQISASGSDLQRVLATATAVSSVVAAGLLWRGITVVTVAAAGVVLLLGMLLVHVVLMPVLMLLILAVVADQAGRTTRERLAEVGPRSRPLPWVAGVAVTTPLLVVGAVLTFYLAEPLFDEGTRLDEGLDFVVAGVTPPPADTDADGGSAEGGSAEGDNAEGGSTGGGDTSENAATGGAGGESGTGAAVDGSLPVGEALAQGELMGADAFHTGSGQVLLLRDPDGNVILRFQDYAVRNGPDLHIYLTPDAGGDVHAEGAIELAPIKATRGSVNYDVPPDVDPATFRAAVIYCMPFGVVFATAVFE